MALDKVLIECGVIRYQFVNVLKETGTSQPLLGKFVLTLMGRNRDRRYKDSNMRQLRPIPRKYPKQQNLNL